MDIPLKGPADVARRANRSRNAVLMLLLGVVAGLYFNWMIRFLPTYQGSGWQKFGLSLPPWLLFAAFLWFQRRVWRKDELEKIIDRDALVFAFHGLLGGLILLGQLQAAGLVPDFKWHNGHILLAMIFMMLAGMAWSKWRYR